MAEPRGERGLPRCLEKEGRVQKFASIAVPFGTWRLGGAVAWETNSLNPAPKQWVTGGRSFILSEPLAFFHKRGTVLAPQSEV